MSPPCETGGIFAPRGSPVQDEHHERSATMTVTSETRCGLKRVTAFEEGPPRKIAPPAQTDEATASFVAESCEAASSIDEASRGVDPIIP
jgi:hypothetical protein